jgi:large subunit ribosomal protein L22
MGKQSHARRLADNEAMAKARHIRVSPRKLDIVAGSIRGKNGNLWRAVASVEY